MYGPRVTDMLLLIGCLCVSLILVAQSLSIGLAASGVLLAGLVLGKARRSRRKDHPWTTWLTYGVFTQILSVSMTAGHLAFWLDVPDGRLRNIDYWGNQSAR